MPAARSRQAKKLYRNVARQSHEDDAQIPGHVAPQRLRHLQKPQNGGEQGVHQSRQHRRHRADKAQCQRSGAAQRRHVPSSDTDSEQRPRAHGKTQKHGGQERRQRERGAYRRQCVPSQRPPHDKGVRHII